MLRAALLLQSVAPLSCAVLESHTEASVCCVALGGVRVEGMGVGGGGHDMMSKAIGCSAQTLPDLHVTFMIYSSMCQPQLKSHQ